MSKPIGRQRLLGASLLAGLIAIVVNTAMLEAAEGALPPAPVKTD